MIQAEIVKAKDIKNFINKNREVTVHLSISVVENVIWLLLSKNIERSRDII